MKDSVYRCVHLKFTISYKLMNFHCKLKLVWNSHFYDISETLLWLKRNLIFFFTIYETKIKNHFQVNNLFSKWNPPSTQILHDIIFTTYIGWYIQIELNRFKIKLFPQIGERLFINQSPMCTEHFVRYTYTMYIVWQLNQTKCKIVKASYFRNQYLSIYLWHS